MSTQSLRRRFLNRKWLSLPVVLLLILVSFSGTTAFSQASDDGPLAEMVVTTTRIRWRPLVEHDGIVLTVAGPGDVKHRQEFAPRETPAFGLVDSEGQSYPDGSYTYELVAKPVLDAEERVALELARSSGDSIEVPRQVQSGRFAISDGMFVTVAAPESSDRVVASPNDEVIYDDLIVDGSLCVGNDCYSGLAFGFDTIVLMENNLRVFFDDTSNTSSFPNNDWRIVINDTTDGGASYFALQDVSGGLTPFTVEAGAKTNSLYVDDDGQVGIGTSGPVFELHIKEGDTPTVRLHQSTSYGWPEQIWDVGGNETSFFIRDGTHAARLPFRIEPGTPSSTMCLKEDGYIGLGTWSPESPLELETTGENAIFTLERTSGAKGKMTAAFNRIQFGSVTNHNLELVVYGLPKATLDTNGDLSLDTGGEMNAAAFNITSDVDAKENFGAVDGKEVLAQLENVEISTWNFKGDDVRHMGPTAQEFYAAYGLGADDRHISTTDTDGVALAAIKELSAQNKALQARLSALEAEGGKDTAQAAQSIQSNILWIVGLLLAGVTLGFGLSMCLIQVSRRRQAQSGLRGEVVYF